MALVQRPPSLQSSSSEDSLERFLPLINAIDFATLTSVAIRVRLQRLYSTDENPSLNRQISCEIDHSPLSGSYNLVYIITFSDSVRWIARFPGNSVSGFTELDRQQMESDIRTMQLIHSKTTFPLPEIFAFETTADTLGAPYALMSFVHGSLVWKRWFDDTWATKERRLKILRGIAKHMAQLHTLQFDKIGALSFDQHGGFTHVGPLIERKNETEDCLNRGRAFTSGPFDSLRAYLLDGWDDLKACTRAQWRKAELAILRLAVESIPRSLVTRRHFALSPPDLDSQNVFVDDEGNITGIIDWDGVQTLPNAAAFARYPSWITRDWDPCMYAYDSSSSPSVKENSPEELSEYRQVYADTFAHLGLPSALYSPNETKLSHILEAIDIGVHSRFCRTGIVPRLLDHAFHSKVPFQYREFCDAFLAGKADLLLKEVEKAFQGMWHAEWE